MDATYTIGTEVTCTDGVCGTLTRVILDPVRRTLTYLVVEPQDGPSGARLVPAQDVTTPTGSAAITLGCDRARFAGFEHAQTEEFLPAEDDEFGFGVDNTLWMPYFPLGATLPGAGALGGTGGSPLPVSRDRVPLGEVEIRRGQCVEATDGRIGKVRGLAVDPSDEQVTHVLLDEGHLWGKKTVAIPIGAVESVTDGIRLRLAKDEVRDLPELELAHGGGAGGDRS
ncbi:PRC-barrel domain-containing protein [Actinospica durhamensis]|uniref:PRC-barrel domain-containing protein n=1 Tax=Actinospica durhamensis TaxID=1508375 RepID=A0A941ITF1_9ACTN|nr:PRC-barrel domain-containing protein [Actinospica durhamensis]MBR7837552.1 PRC-barrel domain-containing protein [Actinospica durhamensis]